MCCQLSDWRIIPNKQNKSTLAHARTHTTHEGGETHTHTAIVHSHFSERINNRRVMNTTIFKVIKHNHIKQLSIICMHKWMSYFSKHMQKLCSETYYYPWVVMEFWDRKKLTNVKCCPFSAPAFTANPPSKTWQMWIPLMNWNNSMSHNNCSLMEDFPC